MAGSRSTAPLNRSNSVLIAALLSAFEIWHVAPLFFLQQNPSSRTVFLSWEHRFRLTPQSFITRTVRDWLVGELDTGKLRPPSAFRQAAPNAILRGSLHFVIGELSFGELSKRRIAFLHMIEARGRRWV